MRFSQLLRLGLAPILIGNAFSASYYLDERGDDAAAGTSPETAWASLERVNTLRLRPGDNILLKGGCSFQGELRIDESGSGRPNAPVIVESYGEGFATIKAGNEHGIHVQNASHLVIRKLKITGNPDNGGYGVLCENTLTNGMCSGLSLEFLEVSSFGKHGIMVTGAPYGFRDVSIRHCTMFNNVKGGMEVAGRLPWDAKHYAHANVTVADCIAYENPGDPNFNENHSGSGIVLYQVDGGVIERCKAWRNGAACPAQGGGPVGIWTCASRRVIIQYCESFGNLSRGLDGGGFDIDGGSEECVLQYNYSHDNRGPGLMVYSYRYASHRDRDNVVRFNISINDALNADRYAGLWIRTDGTPMKGIKAHNNTIITGAAPAAWIHAPGVEVELRNNILYTAAKSVPLLVDGAEDQNGSISLRNNLYWRSGAGFLVRWNGRELRSLAELHQQSTRDSGDAIPSFFVDPAIPWGEAASLKSPLSDFALLTMFGPENAGVRMAGLPPDDVYSKSLPLKDLLGSELTSTSGWPLGAVAVPSR